MRNNLPALLAASVSLWVMTAAAQDESRPDESSKVGEVNFAVSCGLQAPASPPSFLTGVQATVWFAAQRCYAAGMTDSPPPPFEYQKWAHELKREDAQRASDRLDARFDKMNEAAIKIADSALRAAC